MQMQACEAINYVLISYSKLGCYDTFVTVLLQSHYNF